MTAAEVRASRGDGRQSSDIDHAIELMKSALSILDKSDIAPEIRARLAEVVAATEEQQVPR